MFDPIQQLMFKWMIWCGPQMMLSISKWLLAENRILVGVMLLE